MLIMEYRRRLSVPVSCSGKESKINPDIRNSTDLNISS